jgi:hypothetical protein
MILNDIGSCGIIGWRGNGKSSATEKVDMITDE